MFKKIFIVAGVIAFAFVITTIIGDIMMKSQLEKEIEQLFASSKNISDKVYSSHQIKDLPSPVQRYFAYSLQENQPYISYARLKHGGEFRTKPDKKWVSIKGQEYFTVQKPGFVWFGKVPFVSAKDIYCDGKGNLKVRLLSTIKLVDAKGKEVDQGELLRWLAEAPWFPAALLPSEKLKWEPIDSSSAKVILSDRAITVEGIFHFNAQGQITRFDAKRYKDNCLENWTGHYSDYKEVDGMQIPFYVEVVWNLETGDFCYAKFNITEIDFNIPKKYN